VTYPLSFYPTHLTQSGTDQDRFRTKDVERGKSDDVIWKKLFRGGWADFMQKSGARSHERFGDDTKTSNPLQLAGALRQSTTGNSVILN